MTVVLKDGEEKPWSKVEDELEERFEDEEHSWYLSGAYSSGSGYRGFAVPHITREKHLHRWNKVVGSHNWRNVIKSSGGIFKHLVEVRIQREDGTIEWLTKEGVTSTDDGVEGAKSLSTHSFKRSSSGWGVGQYLYRANEVLVDVYLNYNDVPEGEEVIRDKEFINGDKKTVYFARPHIDEAFESNVSSGGSQSTGSKNKSSGGSSSNSSSNSGGSHDEFSRDIQIPWGKYEGTPLRDAETWYLRSMITDEEDNDYYIDPEGDNGDFHGFFKKELKERGELGYDRLMDLVNQIDGVEFKDVTHALKRNHGVDDPLDVDVNLLDKAIEKFEEYADRGEVEKDPEGVIILTGETSSQGSEDNVEEAFEAFDN